MYQVTVKGRNLEELKQAVTDIAKELNSNVKLIKGLSKDLDEMYDEPQVEQVAPVQEIKQAEPVAVATPVKTEVTVDNNQELDVRGLPWDERIHSTKKGKNADGSWRNRRGVDKDLLAQVEAELKATYSNTQPVQEAPTAPALPTTAPVNHINDPAPAVTQPVVEAKPEPVVTPPAPQLNVATGHSVETFKQNFPMILSQLITEGKINQDYVNQLASHFGVSAIYELNDEQKEQLFISFVQFGFIQKV